MTLHRVAFRAMAAENEVQVWGDRATAEIAARRAIAEVVRIEAKYSRYKDDSVVSRINAAAGGKPVAIDDETRSLLGYAHACWTQSGGLFDATSGILRRAWNFDIARVPTDAELAPLVARVGWQHVEIDEQGVRLAKEGMQLDFGGFGKEYAVDRAALVLKESGAESAMVNLAGDLAIVGTAAGRPCLARGHPSSATRRPHGDPRDRFGRRSRRAATTSASSRWMACGIATSSIRARVSARAASSR